MPWRVTSLSLLILLPSCSELSAQARTLARIDTIVPDSAAPRAARTLSELLTGAVPGLMVRRPSGATGSGAYLTMRSLRSYRRNAEPLILVDGIRVDGSSGWLGVETGGVAPTRLDDFSIDDIETIEILKGPAASALYGVDAADGVVIITTRRPEPGSRVIRARAAAGTLHDATSYPANYGLNDDGNLISFNPLERVSPFRTGSRQEAMLAFSGASEQVGLYTRASAERERGVLSTDGLTRMSGRAHVGVNPLQSLRLEVGAHYVRSRHQLPFSGGHDSNVLLGGLAGFPMDDPVRRGYLSTPPEVLLRAFTEQDTDRLQGSVGSEWHPVKWLVHRAIIGVDRTERREHQLVPPDSPGTDHNGRRTRTGQRSSQWHGSTSLSAQYRYRQVTGTTVLAADFLRFDWRDSLRTTSATDETSFIGRGLRTNREMLGVTAAQYVQIGTKVEASFALRTDDPGEGVNRTWHPATSVRWRVRDASSSWLQRLTLRGAAGESGRQPAGLLDAFNADCLTCAPQFLPAHVERTREMEAGLDASLLGRIEVALTVYRQATRDVMVALLRPTQPGLDVSPVARTTNAGLELRAVASVLNTPALAATLDVGVWVNRNRLSDVGDFPPFVIGPRHVGRRGDPLAGYHHVRHRVADHDGDGRLTLSNCPPFRTGSDAPPCELVPGDVAYFGSTLPTREINIGPRIRVGTTTTVGAQLGYVGGHTQFNQTEWLRCLFAVCRAARDPSVSEAEKLHAALISSLFVEPLVQDASNWQLRELWLRHEMPRRWTDRLGVETMTVSLAGRNLATWSSYRGLHPDGNALGPHPYLRLDYFVQPPVRSLVAGIDVTW